MQMPVPSIVSLRRFFDIKIFTSAYSGNGAHALPKASNVLSIAIPVIIYSLFFMRGMILYFRQKIKPRTIFWPGLGLWQCKSYGNSMQLKKWRISFFAFSGESEPCTAFS